MWISVDKFTIPNNVSYTIGDMIHGLKAGLVGVTTDHTADAKLLFRDKDRHCLIILSAHDEDTLKEKRGELLIMAEGVSVIEEIGWGEVV